MRVALFIDSPHPGGAERYFVTLANGLAKRGVETHAVGPVGPTTPYLQEQLGADVRMHSVGSRLTFDRGFVGNSFLAVRPLTEVHRAVSAIAPDLLHISNGGYPGSHTCRAAVFATGRPRLMTINNRAQPRAGGRGAAYRLLDPLVWRSLDAVICPSQATAEAAVRLRGLPLDKTHVVHYGIEPPVGAAADAERVRSELAVGDRLLVGMVAAPDATADAHRKGHHVLLEAMLALGPDAPVMATVVGHDPGPAFVEAAARGGIGEQIRILAGFRETRRYMHAFDVLVIPSVANEGLPLVALEAMAAGTVVAASRLEGLPEAIDDGRSGFLFAPGDAAELATVLRRCLTERHRLPELAAAARKTFNARFSADTMVEATLALYHRVLKRGV